MSVYDIYHTALYKVDVESMLIGEKEDIFFVGLNHLRFESFRCDLINDYLCQSCAKDSVESILNTVFPDPPHPQPSGEQIRLAIDLLFKPVCECVDVPGEDIHNFLLGYHVCKLCKRIPIYSCGNTDDCEGEHVVEAEVASDDEDGILLGFFHTWISCNLELRQVLQPEITAWRLTRLNLIEP